MDSSQSSPGLKPLSEGDVVLSRFKVRSFKGAGGQSTIYTATDLQLERQVALKVINTASDASGNLPICGSNSFNKEARILASLKHPHIISIYAAGLLDDGRFCIVMELLEGKTLAEILKEEGKLSSSDFLLIFNQVLKALQYLHDANVLHLDLKPENILVCGDGRLPSTTGSTVSVKLLDFGIARVLAPGTSSQAQTRIGGTALYMSPEQCKAAALDARSDLYSLACVMYESLEGQPPFLGGSDLDVMYKHGNEPPPKLHAPVKLARAVEKSLSKDPADRFASAVQFKNALPEIENWGPARDLRQSRFHLYGAIILLGTLAAVGLFCMYSAMKQESIPKTAELSVGETHSNVVRGNSRVLFETANVEKDPKKKIELLKIVVANDDPRHIEIRFDAYLSLVNLLDAVGDHPNAKKYSDEFLKLSFATESTLVRMNEWRGAALLLRSTVLRRTNNLQMAEKNAMLGIAEFKKSPPEFYGARLSSAYSQLARIQTELKKYSEARINAIKAIETMHYGPDLSRPDKEALASAQWVLAGILAELQQSQELLKLIDKIELLLQGEDAARISSNVSFVSDASQVASICLDRKNFDIAKQIIERAKSFPKSRDPNRRSYDEETIVFEEAALLLGQQKYRELKPVVTRIEALLDQDKNDTTLDRLVGLATYYMAIPDDEGAVRVLFSAKKRLKALEKPPAETAYAIESLLATSFINTKHPELAKKEFDETFPSLEKEKTLYPNHYATMLWVKEKLNASQK